eukprot:1072870-Rhodomonas_salina.1
MRVPPTERPAHTVADLAYRPTHTSLCRAMRLRTRVPLSSKLLLLLPFLLLLLLPFLLLLLSGGRDDRGWNRSVHHPSLLRW